MLCCGIVSSFATVNYQRIKKMLLRTVVIQKFLIFNKKIKDDPLDTKGIIIVLYKNNIIERVCVHTFYEQ